MRASNVPSTVGAVQQVPVNQNDPCTSSRVMVVIVTAPVTAENEPRGVLRSVSIPVK